MVAAVFIMAIAVPLTSAAVSLIPTAVFRRPGAVFFIFAAVFFILAAVFSIVAAVFFRLAAASSISDEVSLFACLLNLAAPLESGCLARMRGLLGVVGAIVLDLITFAVFLRLAAAFSIFDKVSLSACLLTLAAPLESGCLTRMRDLLGVVRAPLESGCLTMGGLRGVVGAIVLESITLIGFSV